MTHVTCRLTAKNRDQLRNLTLGNRVWATFTFLLNDRGSAVLWLGEGPDPSRWTASWGHLPVHCEVQGISGVSHQSYSLGGSSNAAFHCECCSNSATLGIASKMRFPLGHPGPSYRVVTWPPPRVHTVVFVTTWHQRYFSN